MNTFRRSITRAPDPGPNYAKLMEEQYSRKEAGLPTRIEMMPEPDRKTKASHEINANSESAQRRHIKMVNDAYEFFDKYKGLIVDMIFSFGDRHDIRQQFLSRTEEEALEVLEIELNYFCEVFYTKASVVRNVVGYIFRFLSFGSTLVALSLFIYEDKNGFLKFDVAVTYTVLYGAVAIDTIAFLMLFFSDWTVVSSSRKNRKKVIYNYKANTILNFLEYFLSLRKPKPSKCKKKPYTNYTVLSTSFIFRRWCRKISGQNLISYCLRQCPLQNPNLDSQGLFKIVQTMKLFYFKARQCQKFCFDKVVEYFDARELVQAWKLWLCETSNPLLQKLWKFIMDELKRKSENARDVETTQAICSARGEWILQDDLIDSESIEKLMPFVRSDQVTFDESLIMWHIATHLCYVKDQDENNDNRVFSKLLSDYMPYLLVMQPALMSSVAGIGQIRFQDTCEP